LDLFDGKSYGKNKDQTHVYKWLLALFSSGPFEKGLQQWQIRGLFQGMGLRGQ